MKPVFRVESANEENIRGGWYLLADSLAAAREVYPAHLFPSMTLIEVGKGLCVECNRRAVDALVEEWKMADGITVDIGKIQEWLFSRAEMHRDRGEWDASFEDLYLATAIFRGDFTPDPEMVEE